MALAWEFWIDVGGTFTDCIARQPDGTTTVHKLLSSGIYQGTVGNASTRQCIHDPHRAGDPRHFFKGWRFVLGQSNEIDVTEAVLVDDFECSPPTLKLAQPLTVTPKIGQRYLLVSDAEAPVIGIHWLMGQPLGEPTGAIRVRLGTTRATNALLERQGARTAFLTTAGFKDVLRIAYQNRPRLFDLEIRKPGDLYETVVEAEERLSADGSVLKPLAEESLRRQLAVLRARGIDSLAVCFLHSYRNSRHEVLAGEIARELGFSQISLSHQLNPLPKIVVRGDTTVIDAYLSPVIRDYLNRIRVQLPRAELRLMTSAGSLVSSDTFHGKDAILSGPAGGVVGAASVARLNRLQKIIGFDMGGTSTDVSRFDGEYERRYEMEVKDPATNAGIRVTAPMLAVETVAAGGGSICWFDGIKPMVGPRSAGSDPGPACYGRGGPLCVTDVNLFLGRIIPDRFPFPLDSEAVIRRLDELVATIAGSTGSHYTREGLAQGLIDIANTNMAAPIRSISIARGYDAREYALVSFGGAGSQHACAIAHALGMRSILCPAQAGVLSALGIGMADTARFAEQSIGKRWRYMAEPKAELEAAFAGMEGRLHRELEMEGFNALQITSRRLLDVRYIGQESRITVAAPDDGDWCDAFETLHRQHYGFVFPGRDIEVYAARTELTARSNKPAEAASAVHSRKPVANRTSRMWLRDEHRDVEVFWREQLRAGDTIEGPALIAESIATIVVEAGWNAAVTALNDILLTRCDNQSEEKATPGGNWSKPDPVELELFNNHFASIAEQMGATLQKTALSTNVKERLDFSCAVFTSNGDLVVNAPHIPVHLGAMSECVKCLIEDVPDMKPGEIYVTNDPYRGGSHLPDVTVITPVFAGQIQAEISAAATQSAREALGELENHPTFFVASRAHHSEIGGITPGSMPPFSKSLAEEGVLIRAFRLVRAQRSSEAGLRQILTSGLYPSRAVEENIADINAQSAANQMGLSLLLEMVRHHGVEKVRAYMRHIQTAAEEKMRLVLLNIPEGEHRFTDQMDDGSPIAVTITIHHASAENHRTHPTAAKPRGSAIVDFTGTGPVMSGNLNANRAIVTSAVIYCFRCLIREPIPLNAGVLAPITIKLPDQCLLNPIPHADPALCAAVVGGNVETSQRVVDVIFSALGIVASSQGTMNNFIFGRAGESAFGYYETICGGSGAGPGFDGASAVHTHMTNTRLTDPEVLELRYPVRLNRCEIRDTSGGSGRHRGGNGIIREVEFLEPLEVSLLTSRRTTAPPGLEGGGHGKAGVNLLKRSGSPTLEKLPSSAHIRVARGDTLRLETPGGGGFGSVD